MLSRSKEVGQIGYSIAMSDSSAEVPDAAHGPVGEARDVPVPRLGTPATEPIEESLRAERDAVGNEPDVGGLT